MAFKKWTKSEEQLLPDARYHSKLASKFINCLMVKGKKSVATRVFYGAMDVIESRVKDAPPLEVCEAAVDNVKPRIEVRSRRVGGSNYQVPIPVNRKRQTALAIRWILQAARTKSRQTSLVSQLAQSVSLVNNLAQLAATEEIVYTARDALGIH